MTTFECCEGYWILHKIVKLLRRVETGMWYGNTNKLFERQWRTIERVSIFKSFSACKGTVCLRRFSIHSKRTLNILTITFNNKSIASAQTSIVFLPNTEPTNIWNTNLWLFYQLELQACLTNLKTKGQECHLNQMVVQKSKKPPQNVENPGIS